jgi:serine/threonine protein kinase
MLGKDGKIKLLDFGIAKNTNTDDLDYTKTGFSQQMGTPLYMSPEQIKSTSEVTKATDFYSLGVVLWQMVKGRKVYNSQKQSLAEIQAAIMRDDLPATKTKWDSIITSATQKDPAKRSLKPIKKRKWTFGNKTKSADSDMMTTIMFWVIIVIVAVLLFMNPVFYFINYLFFQ